MPDLPGVTPSYRPGHANLRSAAGTELGTLANPVYVDDVSGGGGAATIADGADVTQGAKADAPATTATTDPWTVVSLLKGLLKIFLDIWNGTTHAIGVTFTNTSITVVQAQNSTITSGQTTINPAAAMLPSHAGKSVKIQSSYANIASGLIIYVGASGSEVIELIAGDTWTFNVSNLNLISAKCTAAMTAALNWIVES